MNLNKRGLAVCVAAALALPATAMAATFNFNGAPINNTYASNLFGSTAVTVTTPATLAYNTELTDNIIGRTTGFGVRLTLVGGPTFVTGTPPVASLGADCVAKEMRAEHHEELATLLKAAGFGGDDTAAYTRYGSARELYHFHVDNTGSY